MNRARATLGVAIVISLPSYGGSQNESVLLPFPVRATLCNGESCTPLDIPAGTKLQDFIATRAHAGDSYRLKLELPAGELSLRHTWLIDGGDIPPEVAELTIIGSSTSTRLTGATAVQELGATMVEDSEGRLVINLPQPVRGGLMPSQRYSGDGAAWPALLDSTGALRLAQWPTAGWSVFLGPRASADDLWVSPDRSAPVAAWRQEDSAWVLGFFRFGWHAEYERLVETRSDTDGAALRLGGKPRYGIGTSGRLRVLNLRSELRNPGEYWIDATRGRLMVIPRAGGAAGTLRLSMLEAPLLKLRGVHDVRVESVDFFATRGHALVVENSERVDLIRLAFATIGRSGIVVDGGHSVSILHNTFVDTGDHAVVFRGGDRDTLTRADHRIEASRILRPSQRIATPATAIRLEGVGHIVRGNTIEDAPHSAIYFEGNDHLIESNWIERVCLDVDDAGAIYAGRDWTFRGNVIRSNVIAALPRRNETANLSGVYLDDMLSGTRVDRNLIFDAPRGVLVGGGRDNLLEDNLFVRTTTSIHIDQRALEWASAAARPGGVLMDRLGRMPYRDTIWRQKYPALGDILKQRPAQPLNNVAHGNAALDSGAAIIAPEATNTRIEAPAPLGREIFIRGSAREFLEDCARDISCAAMLAHMRLPMNSIKAPGESAR